MDVRELTQQWIEALQKGVDSVCALYADNATFHPTFSTKFMTNTEGVREYFAVFVSKKPKVRIVEDSILRLCPQAMLHSGIYEIELNFEGKQQLISARFTFLWQDTDRNWKICHHHSSECRS